MSSPSAVFSPYLDANLDRLLWRAQTLEAIAARLDEGALEQAQLECDRFTTITAAAAMGKGALCPSDDPGAPLMLHLGAAIGALISDCIGEVRTGRRRYPRELGDALRTLAGLYRQAANTSSLPDHPMIADLPVFFRWPDDDPAVVDDTAPPGP